MSLLPLSAHLAYFETCVSGRFGIDCRHRPGQRRDVVAQIPHRREPAPAQWVGSILVNWTHTYVEGGSRSGCNEYTKDLKIGKKTDGERPMLGNPHSTERRQKIDSTTPLSQHFVVVDKAGLAHSLNFARAEVYYIGCDSKCKMGIVAGAEVLEYILSDNLWGLAKAGSHMAVVARLHGARTVGDPDHFLPCPST